jgi:hypothetical protein
MPFYEMTTDDTSHGISTLHKYNKLFCLDLTSLTVYQDWLKREIDKKIINQKVSPAATALTTGKEA